VHTTGASDATPPDQPADAPQAARQILGLGKIIALACMDPATGIHSWQCGRVQKMLRPSKGKTGKPVPFTEDILYLDAVAAKVLVVCTWYLRDPKSKSYTFTYDAEPDSTAYSLGSALGLVELALPRRDRYALLDPSQGPRLDAALELTKPSEKHGSKRTKGEVLQAAEARRAREQYTPQDLGLLPSHGKARKPPTERVRS
jgi:hypothetical protein